MWGGVLLIPLAVSKAKPSCQNHESSLFMCGYGIPSKHRYLVTKLQRRSRYINLAWSFAGYCAIILPQKTHLGQLLFHCLGMIICHFCDGTIYQQFIFPSNLNTVFVFIEYFAGVAFSGFKLRLGLGAPILHTIVSAKEGLRYMR